MPEPDSTQKIQPSITLQALPAGASLLFPLFGVPLALHALTGAAVGALTFTVGAVIVGLTKEKVLKSPAQSLPISSEAPELKV